MRKTIYVKDEDEAIFEEALMFGEDNLSRVIADALKAYVAAKKAEEEVILKVGTWRDQGANDVHKIAFRGRLLSTARVYHGQTSSGDDRGVDWELYQTEKGKFILWWLDWSRWEGEPDVADYMVLDDLPHHGMVCCDTITGDPSYPVPGELIEEAAEVLGRDTVKHLDI